jgi:CBS domain-containing protein
MKNGTINQWMTSPVTTVTPATPIVDAKRIMDAEKIRALPVVRENAVVGIVTRRGLLRTDLPTLDGVPLVHKIELKEKQIADIMTIKPIVVLPSQIMPKAARVMLENKITALPVVDNGALVGIVTNSDIFRFIQSELAEAKKPVSVEEYMTHEVVTITPKTSLIEAQRIMGTERIRALPVLDGKQLVGLVTRTDFMSVSPSRFITPHNQELSLTILSQPVEKIMTRKLITINRDIPITEAARLMQQHKVHCLPVLDAEGKLDGILTESDLFRMVIKKFY